MIGVDIQKIARIKKSLESDAFAERVFTAAEREYCDSRALPEQSYAGMFCAKEAAVKAVKQGFCAISPRDVEVRHADDGSPRLVFYGNAAPFFAGCNVDVSISHDGEYAIAAVQIL